MARSVKKIYICF